MSFSRCSLVGRGRPRRDTAFAAVVAHAVHGDVIDHGLVIYVGDVRVADVVDRAVVIHVPALPVTAFVALAAVTMTIVYTAVKSHVRTPVPGMPDEYRTFDTPKTGSPEVTRLRRGHPGAGHPIIVLTVVAPSPIARSPN